MAFRLIKDPMDIQAEALPISSTAVTVGQVLELDAGSTTWTSGDASTEHWQRKAVAIETVANTAVEVKAILVHPWQLWEADSANTANVSHNGDRMLFASGGLVVNNAGSDNTSEEANFVQKGIVSTGGFTTKVVGYFLGCQGVNPDAT